MRSFPARRLLLIVALCAAGCAPPGGRTGDAIDTADGEGDLANSSAAKVSLILLAQGLPPPGIGEILDEEDRRQAGLAGAEAFENKDEGGSTVWYNRLTSRGGETTVNSEFRAPNGAICKRVTQIVFSDGITHNVRGAACRRGDGSWELFDG